MKVLLVNGSPHKDGCTYTALCEVSEALNEQGIDNVLYAGLIADGVAVIIVVFLYTKEAKRLKQIEEKIK